MQAAPMKPSPVTRRVGVAAVVTIAGGLCACSKDRTPGKVRDFFTRATILKSGNARGPGDELPQVRAVAHTGQLVELADYEGRPLVLWFCRSIRARRCRHLMKIVRYRWARFRRTDTALLGVFGDDGPWVRAAAHDAGLPFLALSDPTGKLAGVFALEAADGGASRPAAVVVDREGKIAGIFSKVATPQNVERVLDTVEKLDS